MSDFLKFLILNWRVIAVVGGFVLAIFTVAQIWSCAVDSLEKRKINKIEKRIETEEKRATESETIANIAANSRREQKKELENAAINTNRSRTDFNRAVNRDSSQSTGNYRRAKELYCEQFPSDSACRK
jgi:biopolymer transport protein ExbB/TolQ